MKFKIKDQNSVKGLALFYCSKRETSRFWLEQYLERKCREQKIPKETSKKWIAPVLDQLEKLEIIDDKRYAGIIIRSYASRGKGRRYIEQKLKQKGIAKDLVSIPFSEEDEIERAIKLIEKNLNSLTARVSKKKYDHPSQKKRALREKILQKLISSGYSFNISQKAVSSIVG